MQVSATGSISEAIVWRLKVHSTRIPARGSKRKRIANGQKASLFGPPSPDGIGRGPKGGLNY